MNYANRSLPGACSLFDLEVLRIAMPATLKITLDAELRDALNRKSRQMALEPEEAVRQLVRDFVQGRILRLDQDFAEGMTVADYLALNDEEDKALWDRWVAEADQFVEPEHRIEISKG
jgi:hypothetical protein